MVRVNCGIEPYMLTDEHLRAENVELQMLLTFISKHPKGTIPNKFSLNKGHISFFRDKAGYIAKRLQGVQTEMANRGMSVNFCIDIYSEFNIPLNNRKEYSPTADDAEIVAERIVERIINPKRKKNPYHYRGEPIKVNFLNIYKGLIK
jgi:deoxyribonuclease (pyrimidine dimer)